ncbi:hypothetical protein TNIN_229902 [Trichonephila inaurata madagascariensis]|uniref:Endonuclease/exonuclease/phosphatase domain-containing protein n=1 Tax=Trichonephila inaurata madagascariensis TaxID=2747483 RepID=A0A8X7C218_9ARAC|nr:hypothetical protein TNIN_229902 [Trichonephila inaurata madagascariensis]
MEADNIDCELVQEPHSYRSSLPGYPSTYRLFYDPNSDIIKAAIIVRSRHLSTFIDNMVTLEVITGSTAFTLFSYYFEPSKNIDSDLHKISQVFSSQNLNRLVWSMDSNSKSELWFSPYSDVRGDKLSEFISANNLFIINEDCGPTFRATQGTSHINITVVGSDLLEDNLSWCLSENESLSDHMGFSTLFLIISSLLLLSTVSCNHDHHDHNNKRKEHSTSESTPDFGKSESTPESSTSLVGQSETFEDMKNKFKLGLGFIISIPIVGLIFLVFCCYCICKCCCSSVESPGAIVIQNNAGQVAPPPPQPQIIVQQPIYQHVPPSYEMQQQRWAQPSQPPQWTPQPMGHQGQYSPNSAYDNPNYTGPVAPPPPYNTGKY